jgi:hypothetical protein
LRRAAQIDHFGFQLRLTRLRSVQRLIEPRQFFAQRRHLIVQERDRRLRFLIEGFFFRQARARRCETVLQARNLRAEAGVGFLQGAVFLIEHAHAQAQLLVLALREVELFGERGEAAVEIGQLLVAPCQRLGQSELPGCEHRQQKDDDQQQGRERIDESRPVIAGIALAGLKVPRQGHGLLVPVLSRVHGSGAPAPPAPAPEP